MCTELAQRLTKLANHLFDQPPPGNAWKLAASCWGAFIPSALLTSERAGALMRSMWINANPSVSMVQALPGSQRTWGRLAAWFGCNLARGFYHPARILTRG